MLGDPWGRHARARGCEFSDSKMPERMSQWARGECWMRLRRLGVRSGGAQTDLIACRARALAFISGWAPLECLYRIVKWSDCIKTRKQGQKWGGETHEEASREMPVAWTRGDSRNGKKWLDSGYTWKVAINVNNTKVTLVTGVLKNVKRAA